jgi:rhombotail lipoprotein
MKPHLLPVLWIALLAAGCTSFPASRRANVLDYLYPQGTPARPPQDVVLDLPLRVGVAFAPTAPGAALDTSFEEAEKRALLESIAAAFRSTPEIESVEVIPTTDLRPSGGFDNLDQIAALHGLEAMALISYEQVQFDEAKRSSLVYWTIVGAYVFEGNRNETHTLLDAAIFDLRSRTLLFRSSGESAITGSSTAVDVARELRAASSAGFRAANEDLIGNLGQALAAFREQAKTGTVRGAGTPAISVTGQAGAGAGSGAGALGGLELALGLALLGLARRRRA